MQHECRSLEMAGIVLSTASLLLLSAIVYVYTPRPRAPLPSELMYLHPSKQRRAFRHTLDQGRLPADTPPDGIDEQE